MKRLILQTIFISTIIYVDFIPKLGAYYMEASYPAKRVENCI